MEYCSTRQYSYTRRDMLRTLSCGFGMMAFSSIAHGAALRDAGRVLGSPSLPGRAKRVIFLCMSGGPSHVDTFDYKPRLNEDDGKAAATGRNRGAQYLGSPFKFQQHGRSGLWISELFPALAEQADRLCMLHGMQTDIPAHSQAVVQMHTGSFQFVRPSMGSWALYGLGTENENMPGFITINPPSTNGGAQNYGSAFLPAMYQGMPIQLGGNRRGPSTGEGLPNIRNPRLGSRGQRVQLDLIQDLNKQRLRREREHPGVEGVIESYELAFRMQAEVPDVMNLDNESPRTRELYGLDDDVTAGFGRQCLLARRCAEAGVRFIEVGNGGWDQHRDLTNALRNNCAAIDRPIAGLLTDLHNRRMLDDTLVIWGGEFGRTPYAQSNDGRDHNHKGFTMWMAGGGVKAGYAYGQTDEHGAEAVENAMHIHDWHATILHLLGLNHEELTYQYAGRDFRLTDVYGKIAHEIIA